jgi:hypothetical protein
MNCRCGQLALRHGRLFNVASTGGRKKKKKDYFLFLFAC